MLQQKRPEQVPQRSNEATDTDPDGEPKVSEEPNGESSSRLNQAEEPGENEEKRRVVEKLREREHNS